MLTDALKRLTKHSIVYALGPAAQKAIGFLLLPLVTAYIGTTANYGVVEMAAVTLAVAGQLFGINLLHGMTRYHAEYASEEERGRLVTTCLILLAATTGTALGVALFFRETGAALLFGSSGYQDALVVVAAILFLQTLGQVGLRWLQILERSVAYGVLTTVKTALEVGLKVWLLVGLGLTFMGVLYSVLGGELAVAAGMTVWIVRRLGLSFSWPMAKRLIRYSYPLILSGLCMFVLHQADRWFVLRWHGQGEVGLYGLAYKLGSMANAVVFDAFGLIWFPFIFGVRDPEAVRRICRAVLTYLSLIMCFVSLALAVFSAEIVRVMAAHEFFESHRAMPVVVAGYLCWAVFQIVHTGFYLRERTGLVSALVGGAAALNLALNRILVPEHGYMGAAWATLATFAALAIASWVLAERLMPVGYEIRRVVVPIVLSALLFLASQRIPADLGAAALAAKAALVLALPAILRAGGYLRPEEKAKIGQMRRDLVSRIRRPPGPA